MAGTIPSSPGSPSSSSSSSGSNLTTPAKAVTDVVKRRNKRPADRKLEAPTPPRGCSMLMGVCAEQNSRHRRVMEDTHRLLYSLPLHPDFAYAAVFDGHGGHTAAVWCRNEFHKVLDEELSALDGSDDISRRCISDDHIQRAIDAAFCNLDEQMRVASILSGCTAAVCLLDKSSKMMYAGNCGDARIVLFRDGRAIRMSYDHKGSDYHEQERVVTAGGFISNDRVSGLLAITRALGDKQFKYQVCARPFTAKTALQEGKDKLVIVACDGFFDVIADQEACEMAMKKLEKHLDDEKRAQIAAKHLVKQAIKRGSFDNVTVVVCAL